MEEQNERHHCFVGVGVGFFWRFLEKRKIQKGGLVMSFF